MIRINMQVAECVDKIANFEIANVSDQMSEQRVAADIERHTQESISRTLVELAMQYAAVFHLKLKQRVTRRQVHFISLSRVPTRHD